MRKDLQKQNEEKVPAQLPPGGPTQVILEYDQGLYHSVTMQTSCRQCEVKKGQSCQITEGPKAMYQVHSIRLSEYYANSMRGKAEGLPTNETIRNIREVQTTAEYNTFKFLARERFMQASKNFMEHPTKDGTWADVEDNMLTLQHVIGNISDLEGMAEFKKKYATEEKAPGA